MKHFVKIESPKIDFEFLRSIYPYFEFGNEHHGGATNAPFPHVLRKNTLDGFPQGYRDDSYGVAFYKTEPNSTYDWHIDTNSSAVIIGQVTSGVENSLEIKHKGMVYGYTYEPDTLYILNVNLLHMARNLSKTDDRVIFRVSYNFDGAFDYLINHDTVKVE